MRLWELKPGEEARVRQVITAGGMGRRLMDLGLVPGTPVVCLGENPGRNLRAYYIRGAVIALREGDSNSVLLHGKGGTSWA